MRPPNFIMKPGKKTDAVQKCIKSYLRKTLKAVSDFLPSIGVFPFMIFYLLKHFGSDNPTEDYLLDMAFESQTSIWVNISGLTVNMRFNFPLYLTDSILCQFSSPLTKSILRSVNNLEHLHIDFSKLSHRV